MNAFCFFIVEFTIIIDVCLLLEAVKTGEPLDNGISRELRTPLDQFPCED